MDLSPSQFVDEFSNFIESQRAKGLAIYTSFSQDVPPVVVAANSTPNTSIAHTTTVAGKNLPGIYLHLAQRIVYYEYTIMYIHSPGNACLFSSFWHQGHLDHHCNSSCASINGFWCF